uniref:Uncharacterized protein n=1 Tax=Romanomermis culicivorax TaxID=13658 RepID=A0A915KJW6_ROMCU
MKQSNRATKDKPDAAISISTSTYKLTFNSFYQYYTIFFLFVKSQGSFILAFSDRTERNAIGTTLPNERDIFVPFGSAGAQNIFHFCEIFPRKKHDLLKTVGKKTIDRFRYKLIKLRNFCLSFNFHSRPESITAILRKNTDGNLQPNGTEISVPFSYVLSEKAITNITDAPHCNPKGSCAHCIKCSTTMVVGALPISVYNFVVKYERPGTLCIGDTISKAVLMSVKFLFIWVRFGDLRNPIETHLLDPNRTKFITAY